MTLSHPAPFFLAGSYRSTKLLLALALFLPLTTVAAQDQARPDQATPDQPKPDSSKSDPPRSVFPPTGPTVFKTLYLTNISQQNEANELLVALRNMLDPRVKIYLDSSQSAILLNATPDQIQLAQKILADIDRPKKTYRLTYTLTDIENGKPVGTAHFSMIVVTGQRTVMKQGSKVPVQTGSYNHDKGSSEQQYTYLDVGMNFDASLDEFLNGVRLRTKVEQSSIAAEPSAAGANDPIVRQAVFEGTTFLAPGKPLILGSLDIPSTPRHLDIAVVMELVP